METKKGRPRTYASSAPEGFGENEIGQIAGEIGEFRERVFDQIEDLPDGAVNFVAPATTLSIGWLVVHMIDAEAKWAAAISAAPLPQSILEDANYRRLTPYGTAPNRFGPARELVALARRLFDEYTLPTLKALNSLGDPSTDPRLCTAGEVLRHVKWHWVYHSGHIGLIRLQWGSEYEWTFAALPSSTTW